MPATKGKAAKGSTDRISLPAKLDQKAVSALADELRGRRGGDLMLDAAATRQLGSLAVQTLLCAARSWARDGRRLALVNLSDACVEQLRLLGFSPETLLEGATS